MLTKALKIFSYEIELGNGLLQNFNRFISDLESIDDIKACSAFALISDDHIKPLYSDLLKKCFINAQKKCFQFSFPQGERHKTRATKEILEDQMLENGLGADTCLIAVGGGVTTDLAGFLASTYCRGVPYVIIPTSLLAMVDASIGGKNGVNTSFGKNLIGTINQPKKVIIDIEVLKTLRTRDLRDGFVEIIKHALIADPCLFDYLVKHSKELLCQDSVTLEHVIFESCRIKSEIVMLDEKAKGKRNLLNFGHTIGHALENLTDYSLTHGEAVAIGILVESYIAFQMKLISQTIVDCIRNVFLEYGLPLKLKIKLAPVAMLQAMSLDKKSLGSSPRFVIIEKVGSCLDCDSKYCMPVEEDILLKALHWMNTEFAK